MGCSTRCFGTTPGYGLAAVVLTLTYLWLPYMVLPVYAGLDRLPASHLEASADLGAGAWTTFRRVVLPAVKPSIAAGTIFTFSLSLGDYIAVSIVGGKLQVLGTTVLQNNTLDLPVRGRPRHRVGAHHGRLPARRAPHRRPGQPVRWRR